MSTDEYERDAAQSRKELNSKAERLIQKADATIVGIAAIEARQLGIEDQIKEQRRFVENEIRDLKNEQLADLRTSVQTADRKREELWHVVDNLVKDFHSIDKKVASFQAGAYVFYIALVTAAGAAGFFISTIVQAAKLFK